MTSTKSEAAAAVRIGAGLALRKRNGLLGLLRPCLARTEPWLRRASMCRRCQRAAAGERMEFCPASRGHDAGQDAAAAEPRELGHVRRDDVVRRFAAAGLEQAVRRRGRDDGRRGRRDRQGKAGEATEESSASTWVRGRVANRINAVHLSYVRDKAGHALIGARR